MLRTQSLILLAITLLSMGILISCQKKKAPNSLIVGTIAGPETQLMVTAKKVARKCYGLKIKIVTFSDYNMPNAALAEGSLDANAFQHLSYLKTQIKLHGYKIVAVGKTFLYPMAIYSKKIKVLSNLKPGSKIAIPNDPSNEARALLLLQSAKLIQLKQGINTNATPLDIISNPLTLKLISLDAAELPRVLNSVAIAAINTNYATPAGLSASNILLKENSQSPYTNIIAARQEQAQSIKIKELVEAYQSKAVIREAKKIFGDQAIAGFTVKTKKCRLLKKR